jgi:hypothetical protein
MPVDFLLVKEGGAVATSSDVVTKFKDCSDVLTFRSIQPITAMANRAITLEGQGKLEEAATMQRGVLEKRRRIKTRTEYPSCPVFTTSPLQLQRLSAARPLRTCPGDLAPTRGCSCWQVWRDAPCPAPPPSAPAFVDTAARPPRTCPSCIELPRGCSCCQVCPGAFCLAPSHSGSYIDSSCTEQLGRPLP